MIFKRFVVIANEAFSAAKIDEDFVTYMTAQDIDTFKENLNRVVRAGEVQKVAVCTLQDVVDDNYAAPVPVRGQTTIRECLEKVVEVAKRRRRIEYLLLKPVGTSRPVKLLNEWYSAALKDLKPPKNVTVCSADFGEFSPFLKKEDVSKYWGPVEDFFWPRFATRQGIPFQSGAEQNSAGFKPPKEPVIDDIASKGLVGAIVGFDIEWIEGAIEDRGCLRHDQVKFAPGSDWLVIFDQACDQNNSTYQEVLLSIREFRVCGFDTESWKSEFSQLQIAGMNGKVAIFRSFQHIPEAVINILEDRQITLISSDVQQEIKKLGDIRCTSFLDTINLVHLYFPEFRQRPGMQTLQKIVAAPKEPREPSKAKGDEVNYARKPQDFYWNPGRDLLPVEVKHACRDVRIPLAALLLAVKQVSLAIGCTPRQNLTPVLDLVRFTLQGMPKINYSRHSYATEWFDPQTGKCIPGVPPPFMPGEEGLSIRLKGTTSFRTVKEVAGLLRISCRFAQRGAVPLPPGWSCNLKSPFCLDSAKQVLESGIPAPQKDVIFPHKLCSACGEFGHRKSECQADLLKCNYPLCAKDEEGTDGATGPHQTHSLTVCPILHGLCEACSNRGHLPRHHDEACQVVLDELFLQWSPQGRLTSLVWMEGSGLSLPPEAWRYGLYNCTTGKSPKLEKMMGVEEERSSTDQGGCRRNRSNRKLAQQGINAQ